MNEEMLYDVRVENALKSYDGNPVLKGLNMNVTSGSIYALLGPSGCGKSTLLQCILGITKLDSGYIDLKAECIKDIGYMPQRLCLDETLTIKETFEYYASLYNMSSAKLKSRTIELDKFLHLPDMNKFIKNISGGQSRRLSLAIALLHDPKFIILDEPTVGIDPIMRTEIWAEFVRMVEQRQKTVIVTTHYIEEATQANCIGFMRNGLIIEEKSPQHMFAKYETDSLETCFFKACYNKKNNKMTSNSNDKTQVQVTPTQKKITKLENNISLYRIKALLKKHYRVYSRDYILIYTMVFLPLFQITNFCFSIGGNFKNMSIAIKNDEVDFKTCPYSNLSGCIFDENNNQTMSCAILNHLQSLNYNLVGVKDREAGETSMSNLNSIAFLYFPRNYTREFAKYFDDHDNFDVKNLNYAHINKDNYLIKNQMTVDLLNSMTYLIKKTLNGCSNNTKSVSISLEYTTVFGHEVKSYANSIVSVFLAISVFYFPSVFTVSIMMSQKMDGQFSRSIYAGVKISEMLLSVFCISTILNLILIFITYLISFEVFNHPMTATTDGIILYLLLALLLGWIGFFSGLFVAVTTPTQIGGVYIITGLSFSQYVLSGSIWPSEGQPKWLYILSEFLPIRLTAKMMTNIALKGWTLTHPSIIFGTTTMLSYIMIIILALIVLGKYKHDLWVIQNK